MKLNIIKHLSVIYISVYIKYVLTGKKIKMKVSVANMEVKGFELIEKTISTIAKNRQDILELLEDGEISQEFYEDSLDEIAEYDDNLLCAWGDKEDWYGGLFNNAGLVIFDKNGELVDFLGYC
jgi:hypothetical protein